MPTISKITTQQKNKQRYNIFIDEGKGEEYAFSVDESVLIKYQLKKGLELDELFLTEIHYEDDISKAYQLALRHLERKMRSESEIRKYLSEKEVDAPIIQEVIIRLYEYKFLNDIEYAHAYVRTQMNTSGKGTVLIRRELKEKGINDKHIEKALLEYSFDLQLENAQQLCVKMVQKNQKDSEKMLMQKIEQMLIRKGFSQTVISEAVTSVKSDQDKDDMQALRIQGEKIHRKYSAYTGFEYTQKMKQALYRKGFSLEQIDTYLEEIREGSED
jgi:regulatory protein